MRKLIGLLAAVVFVAAAASMTFAQTTSTSSFFTAEISFVSTNTTFGFTLLQMAGTMPAAGDLAPASGKIGWDVADPSHTAGYIAPGYTPNLSFRPVAPAGGNGDTSAAAGGYGPGTNATWFATSKTYAKITCTGLPTGSTVLFYTQNSSGTASATTYKADPMVNGSTLATAMCPMYGANTSTNSVGLPIAYRMVNDGMSSIQIDTVAGNTTAYSSLTSIAQLDISADQDLTNPAQPLDIYGNFMVLDYGTTGATGGFDQPIYGIPNGYSVIATDQGFRWGLNGTSFDQNWALGQNTYMFFATSAFNARPAFRYGTNYLTVQTITE